MKTFKMPYNVQCKCIGKESAVNFSRDKECNHGDIDVTLKNSLTIVFCDCPISFAIKNVVIGTGMGILSPCISDNILSMNDHIEGNINLI